MTLSVRTGALVRTNLGLRWCTCDPRQRYRHHLSVPRASWRYRFRTSVPEVLRAIRATFLAHGR